MASWTDKQKRFVEEYCVDCNQTQAATRAGYSARTAKYAGSRLMRDPDIRAAVEERLDELAMSAAEATMRMGRIARGDIADCYTIIETDDGDRLAMLDLVQLLESGESQLVRKVKRGKHGVEVTMYDAQEALRTILKMHSKLGARGTEDDPVHVTHSLGWTDDDD